MYLMLCNNEVLYFNFDDFVVEVINNDLVPFCMRGTIRQGSSPKDLLFNVQLLKSYLSRRVLSLSRDNAKQIYSLFGIPQLDDIETRVNICLKCKGVSITDSYWLKDDTSNEHFDDVNIRKKPFKSIIDIALNGINPSVSTSPLNPELTTHGLFRKAWIRDEGDLYLLKSDKHSSNINTRMEVLASKMLGCFTNRINCVEYTGRLRNTKVGKIYVDKCKNFVDETHSFVEAWELMEYARNNNISYRDKVLGYTPEAASIGVLDFILSNTDRHTQNYGFMMNNKTGYIDYLAPLFDFNCALVSDIFNRDASDTLSQMFNSSDTLRQIADFYRPYSKVSLNLDKFNKLRTNNKDYDYVFVKVLDRCRYLGIV